MEKISSKYLRQRIYSFLRLVVDAVKSTTTTTTATTPSLYSHDMSFGYLTLWFDQSGQRFDTIDIQAYTLMDKDTISILYKGEGGIGNPIDWYYSVLAHIYEAYAYATLSSKEIKHLEQNLRRKTSHLLKQCEKFPDCQFLDMDWNNNNSISNSVIPTVEGMGDDAIPRVLDYDQRSFNFYEDIERYPQISASLLHEQKYLNQLLDTKFWYIQYRMVQKFYSSVTTQKLGGVPPRPPTWTSVFIKQQRL